MVAMFDGGMGSSTIILKEYYIYVSNLIAIYSKGFFWIFWLILPLCSIYRHGGHDGWSAVIGHNF